MHTSSPVLLMVLFITGWCGALTRPPASGSSPATVMPEVTKPAGTAVGRPTVKPGQSARPVMPVLPPPTAPPAPAVCKDALNATSPLGRLREAMRNTTLTRQQPLDAYIVFYTDEHLSEEPALEERRLKYISGWGESGVGVVLARAVAAAPTPSTGSVQSAALWVSSGDLQRARHVMSCAWQVFDADDPAHPTAAEWIADRGGRVGRVGADARMVSVGEWQQLSTQLQREEFQLLNVPLLVDMLWADEQQAALRRPVPSKIVAYLHPQEFTGDTWRERVSAVRAEMRAAGADTMVVAALDEVAWLLGVRGRDVPHAPLLRAFVVIGMRDLHVYVPAGKLPMPVREALAADNCLHNNVNCTQVHEYSAIYTELRWRSAEWGKVLIPTGGTFQRGTNAAIAQSVPHTKRLFQPSPLVYLKAQKNIAEAAAMRTAHLKDAVAMCTFLCYMEKNVKRMAMDEAYVAYKVDGTRATQAGYVSLSMRTRVAFGANSGDPDYQYPDKSSNRIYTNSTLVVRSGGQYDEGTTVVTRTLHYGVPSQEQRRAYTQTLRSAIALSSLQAPGALPAAHADPIARAPLWAARKNYPHPTGHGVGAALNLREDPVVIDYRQDTNLHNFKEGYFVTCEPAWYEPRRFGVQLGNVLETIGRSGDFLAFKEATLVPYEPKLIDRTLLTDYEINWLNNYNERIRKEVGPELTGQGLFDELYWMNNKTMRIEPLSVTRKIITGSAISVYAHYTYILSCSILLAFK